MSKISFTPLTEENASVLARSLSGESSKLEAQIDEIISGFSRYAQDDELACAFSMTEGCLAVRIFDMGRYFFPFPFELDTENSNIMSAVESVTDYCIKEEIPIVFTDVPSECVSVFASLRYKHLEIKREQEDEQGELTYRVSVKTECTELYEIPSVGAEVLTFSEITEDDVADYARVSRDSSSLEFWGYDYRNDMPNASDEYFYRIMREEFDIGSSLTLAVRLDGKLIGECVLYAFDAKGGADFAFRILPEYRGRGLGAELYELTCEIARKIGLDYLMADILKENTRSRALIRKRMELVNDDGKVYRYRIIL